MKFRTEIDSPKFDYKLKYFDKIFSIGSCFAQNVADFLSERKINILPNPFGVLYNPISIENAFKLMLNKINLDEEDIILNQHEWHSFYHHSDFSSHIIENLLSKIEEANTAALNFLNNSKLVIITLGTSVVYRKLSSNKIVSNCHKIPQKEFQKSTLTIDEVVVCLKNIIELVRSKNSEMEFVFTVSPVRHWKDGAEENQRSKATLLLAIDEIIKSSENVSYFPSYEMMIDDLRDYRFYKNDLVHPNDLAVEYISEKFINSTFDEQSKAFMKEALQITNALNHKVRNKESETYKKFVEAQISKINLLKEKYSEANFTEEIIYCRKELESM